MSPKSITKFLTDLIGRSQLKSQHFAGYLPFSSLTGNILPLMVRLDKLNKPAVEPWSPVVFARSRLNYDETKARTVVEHRLKKLRGDNAILDQIIGTASGITIREVPEDKPETADYAIRCPHCTSHCNFIDLPNSPK
jgi:hypothetical protein